MVSSSSQASLRCTHGCDQDGSETGNSFVNNLGCLTLPSFSLLESDQTPSTFWITNLDNRFEGNVAAGGAFFGFWINLPVHPDGSPYATLQLPICDVTAAHRRRYSCP